MEASGESYQGLLIPETETSFGTSLESSRIQTMDCDCIET